MYCINCEHFKDNSCSLESIYASGYLKECPNLNNGEPIVSKTGSNLQIMTECISLPGRLERIEVTPRKKPGEQNWYASVMFCFEGKGLVMASPFSKTLPLGSIWHGWQYARIRVKEINHKGLLLLRPLIDLRIGFDYSVLEYREIRQLEEAPVQIVEPVREPVKMKVGFIPVNDENLLDVQIPDNSGAGQMSLFAI